ncbi:MAG: hypothetical protein PWQ66_1259 [Petrotoga sp.]|nr:hypothetical protein [Petrotoga sp.]
MNREIELFLKDFNEVIIECGKFLFISRDKEFQQEAVKKLTTLKQRAISLKEQMIKVEDENSANTMLSLENLIDAMVNELEMWIALKEDDPNKAWDFLINAQSAVRTAAQVHSIAIKLNAEGYANKLHLIEKFLFPPQMFVSPSFIIEKVECSICGKEYGECEHIVGKAYMGKMCYKKITKIKDVKEISIVEEPADKHARVHGFTDDDGVTRDFMTWRKIEKNE